MDGFQLILQTLHDFGSPHELQIADLKRHVGDKLDIDPKELSRLALEKKARNLALLGSKDTTAALKPAGAMELEEPDEDESAAEESVFAELLASEAIPQPVFDLKGTGIHSSIRILDPLLSYMIKWHPEVIVESGRT